MCRLATGAFAVAAQADKLGGAVHPAKRQTKKAEEAGEAGEGPTPPLVMLRTDEAKFRSV